MTQGLLISRIRKNNLMKLSVKTSSATNIQIYKDYRNLFNKIVRLRKKLYYQNELERNKTNLKKSWSILNEILNRKNRNSSNPLFLRVGVDILNNPKDVANRLNNFFTSIASEIASKINPAPTAVSPPPSFHESDLFNMSAFPIQQAELVTSLNLLQPKK